MSGSDLDFRPETVNLQTVAGDSVSFQVHLAGLDAAAPDAVWQAQVRGADGEAAEDFSCSPITDGVAVLLTPEQTRRLYQLESCGPRVVGPGVGGRVWTGRYDIQLVRDTTFVRTLVRGELRIETDVTP